MVDQDASTSAVDLDFTDEIGSSANCRAHSYGVGVKRRQPGAWQRIFYVAVLVVGVVAGGLAVGSFLKFADSIIGASLPEAVDSDAIVVLTGGSDRIAHALALLKESRAKRLLISGVHPSTTTEQIVRKTASRTDLFACCVDLDRKALNTTENAKETAKWAEDRGFSRLLVVTSAYHMPRSLLELQSAMPNATLVPYPVMREDFDLHHWYFDAGMTRLLLREYVKYMVTRFRMGVSMDVADATAAPAPR